VARVAALAPDLFFASKIDAMLRATGHEPRIEPTIDALAAAAREADVVIVDLHAEDAEPAEIVQRVAGKPLLGFYSHVEVEVRRRAEQAGFSLVVPRSRVARELPQLIDDLTPPGDE
jgi:hypothetical protein